jgi:hypothetical protein
VGIFSPLFPLPANDPLLVAVPIVANPIIAKPIKKCLVVEFIVNNDDEEFCQQ